MSRPSELSHEQLWANYATRIPTDGDLDDALVGCFYSRYYRSVPDPSVVSDDAFGVEIYRKPAV